MEGLLFASSEQLMQLSAALSIRGEYTLNLSRRYPPSDRSVL